MGIRAVKNYDPATAVTYATTALLAMTAFDTTNLRCSFTAPSSGAVTVRIACTVHGATTFPSILLGVLDGSTVVCRQAPIGGLKNTAVATAFVTQEMVMTITGLTSGATYNWDAAYGVETVLASTGIKCGGPNNATANDAYGALIFEVWDA